MDLEKKYLIFPKRNINTKIDIDHRFYSNQNTVSPKISNKQRLTNQCRFVLDACQIKYVSTIQYSSEQRRRMRSNIVYID